MSKKTFIGMLLSGLLVAGCGTSPAAAPASSAAASTGASTGAAPRPSCLAGTGARHRALGGAHPVEVYALGHSPHVVVASNQSDEDLCAWVGFARRLVARHLQVLLYDYSLDPVRDLTRVVRDTARRGARGIAVLGASEGAKTSITVAAARPHLVTGVVSLSTEEFLDGVDVERSARRLRAPVLFVSARRDSYGSAEASHRFVRVAPARDKRLLMVPGNDHGTALLHHRAVARQVVGFLAGHALNQRRAPTARRTGVDDAAAAGT